jgi:hypothetical protein
MRARRKITLCLIPLYVVTWIGGYYSHSDSLNRETQRLYEAAQKSDAEYAALAAKEGSAPLRPQAHKDGPKYGVSWCAPVLPGVLIADSYYSVGPLYGRGGVKIVIYYGFGSWASSPIWGWIS